MNTLPPNTYLDTQAAEKVREFFKRFCGHYQGKWRRERQTLDLLPWQWNEFILPLYGVKSLDDHQLHYNLGALYIGKKNGKSFLVASCACHALFGVDEPGARVVLVANTLAQAKNLFDVVAYQVESSDLRHHAKIHRTIKTIDGPNDGRLEVWSGEAVGKRGPSVSFFAFDEFCEPAPYQRQILTDLQHSGAAREHSLGIMLSSAHYDRSGIGWELFREHQALQSDPTKQPRTLAVIYSCPQGEDWSKEETWRKYNPSCDTTVPIKYYRSEYEKAKVNPRLEADFRLNFLCQWHGSATGFIPHHVWDACKEPYTEEDLIGETCIVGADFSRNQDLTAYVLLFPREDKLYIVPRFFIPADRADIKTRLDNIPYHRYHDAGLIHYTQGDMIDGRYILDRLKEDAKRFNIQEIGFDPNGPAQVIMLEARDSLGIETTEVNQSPLSLSPAVHELERLAFKKLIVHPGHEILDWCIGNCSVEKKGDLLMIVKYKQTARIDGASALLCAISRWMINPPATYPTEVFWA